MQLSRVWVVFRSDSDSAERAAKLCAEQLKAHGAVVMTVMSGLHSNPYPGLLADDRLPDLVLVLGGDGTVLGAARYLGPLAIPILCFNVGGHLGFLTHENSLLEQLLLNEGEGLWQRLQDSHYALERRMMLQARVERHDGIPANGDHRDGQGLLCHLALNDMYLRPAQEESSPTCRLELAIDGEVVGQYQGDGLIVATPTGSTGYAMASGGPILHPSIDAIVVNPICPMSLSSRPVVVPPRSRLSISPLGDAGRRVKLWKDGAMAAELQPGDRCLVSRAEHHAVLVVLEQQPSYFGNLSRKLHWAGSLTEALPSQN
ncbi:MAG: NAD(+) kinase [Synechococcus lacustris]